MDHRFEADPHHAEYKDTQYLRMRLATVTRVDTDKYTVDISYRQETGGRTDVLVSTAYWSPSAFMGIMPEIGAMCVVAFFHQGVDTWMPVIMSWLPSGAQAARRGEAQYTGVPPQTEDDTYRVLSTKVIRGRLKKIYPGQGLIQSTEGSDITLTEDIHLSNASGQEFTLRADDGHAVVNAIGSITNTPGYRQHVGPVTRNGLVLDDHMYQDGDSLVDPTDYEQAVSARLIQPVTLSSGKKVNYVGPVPTSPDEGGIPYTEVHTEIDELSPVEMRYTEDTNMGSNVYANNRPLIEHTQGTVVGHEQGDPDTYGKPLKAKIFTSIMDSTGVLTREEAWSSKGVFAPNDLATEAIADYERIGRYERVVTKTGNMYVQVPRSEQEAPMGDGHSIDAMIEGSVKVSIGAEGSIRNSAYITTQGSIKMVVGPGGTNTERGEQGRSIDIITQGGANYEYRGTDANETSLRTMIAGKEYKEVGRDQDTIIRGNQTHLVHGASTENVMGKKALSTTGGHYATVGGDWKNVVIGEESNQIGQGRKVLIATPGLGVNADVLTILAGNRLTTITLGNDVSTVAAGNVVETIGAGSKTTTIGTGAYTLTVGAGAITISNGAGAIAISTAAGAMSLAATGIVQITGGIINVTGGAVNLGALPIGGVVTSMHPCLVTGAPHIGSLTVRASL